MTNTYPYSRYVLSGTNSIFRVYDRILRRQVSPPFTERHDAMKEIERLHDLDRAGAKPKETCYWCNEGFHESEGEIVCKKCSASKEESDLAYAFDSQGSPAA